MRATTRFPTTTPDETLSRAIHFFRTHSEALTAIDIASFGPVDLQPASPTWGHVTTTPTPGGANTDVAGALGRPLDVPLGFDTDVNGAALAAQRWGRPKD
jgi:fructokinase